MYQNRHHCHPLVHGDIRHLENVKTNSGICNQVHGDIRHLEIFLSSSYAAIRVHGDIRHLEKIIARS